MSGEKEGQSNGYYIRTAPTGKRNGMPPSQDYVYGAPRPDWAVRALVDAGAQFPEPAPVRRGRPRKQLGIELRLPPESVGTLPQGLDEVCDGCMYVTTECKCPR